MSILNTWISCLYVKKQTNVILNKWDEEIVHNNFSLSMPIFIFAISIISVNFE